MSSQDTVTSGAGNTIPPQPEQIGPYRVTETLGHGGMGIVYLAEQTEPIRRQVAVKVIKLGMDTEGVLSRFRAEQQALALMEHECIAKVIDGGSTPTGRPYFAMEFVRGIPIDRYCDAHELDIDARLALFQRVCSGVQHAHQKGVIHRDLTPRNVLVTTQDDTPTPKIIDFGLARAIEVRLVEQTIYTEQGLIRGTPQYMSPEQAGLGGLDIDTRTDVYSLGCLLYELLVGQPPFSSAEIAAAGYEGVQRMIREQDPPKPSTRISTQADIQAESAKLRRCDPPMLAKRLRGDLDWIVMKALEKDRERRYDTPASLADDIQRHLDDENVVAHAPSFRYRAQKFMRRYRGQVAAATALTVTVLIGLAFSLHFWFEAVALAEREGRERVTAQRNLDRYNSLRNVILLRQAKAAELELYPALPFRLRSMRRWLREFAEPLLTAVDSLRTLVGTLDASDPDRDDQFLRETLAALIDDIREFDRTIVAGVRERIAWAENMPAMTLEHPNCRTDWEAATRAIATADDIVASSMYAAASTSFALEPQFGLVPIGMNPVTRLWEFYDLRSAFDPARHSSAADIAIPVHRPDGSIDPGPGSGIVFVLVPGGRFHMGSQAIEPDGPNYDPIPRLAETPVHEVQLAPFLLGRYEVTQAQWQRLAGGANPSEYSAGSARSQGHTIHPSHPVENVSWLDGFDTLRRAGLALPTESQWEYACRAGGARIWSTGDLVESLTSGPIAANLVDHSAKSLGTSWSQLETDVDDGWPLHAPVDRLAPNPWGFHHMHGNVWEWCRDGEASYGVPVRPGDGLRSDSAPRFVRRGGSFMDSAHNARSAVRSFGYARHPSTGLRAARELSH